jgi:hypothetical protein
MPKMGTTGASYLINASIAPSFHRNFVLVVRTAHVSIPSFAERTAHPEADFPGDRVQCSAFLKKTKFALSIR